MANALKDKLVSVLISLQQQGMTPEQAVEHILQAIGESVGEISRLSIITPELIAEVLRTVYQDQVSARQIAMILQRLGYDRQAVAATLREQFPELSRSGGATGA